MTSLGRRERVPVAELHNSEITGKKLWLLQDVIKSETWINADCKRIVCGKGNIGFGTENRACRKQHLPVCMCLDHIL